MDWIIRLIRKIRNLVFLFSIIVVILYMIFVYNKKINNQLLEKILENTNKINSKLNLSLGANIMTMFFLVLLFILIIYICICFLNRFRKMNNELIILRNLVEQYIKPLTNENLNNEEDMKKEKQAKLDVNRNVHENNKTVKKLRYDRTLEFDYNKFLCDKYEKEFMEKYNGEKVDLVDYQLALHSDSDKIFTKNIRGFFILVENKNKIKLFPVMNRNIKGQYYDLFSIAYNFKDSETNESEFNIERAAIVEKIGNNEYILLEKGMINLE